MPEENKPNMITNIEQVIISQLSNLRNEVALVRTDIAVNTTKTDAVSDQVKKINGSVSEHQKDIQSLKETAIVNASLAKEGIRETEGLKGDVKALQVMLEAKETRIGALENWRWYVVGITAAALFFIGLYLRSIKF